MRALAGVLLVLSVACSKPPERVSAPMVSVPGDPVMGIKPFRLDVTEVTVAAYAECVKAGVCTQPNTGDACNWNVSGQDQHPINCVDWMQADAFCKAQGKRLPDQAEWQFAASNGGRTKFPWGDSSPDTSRAKWDSRNGTSPVGTHPAGATQSGIQDLSGNVDEWMANDLNPGAKEIRGGSWLSLSEGFLLAAHRDFSPPGIRFDVYGFRCAQ